MERREDVKIKSGIEYDQLFPEAELKTIVKKKGATVADTIRFIPQVVKETLFHTKNIAAVLKRDSVSATCKAIWQFVYDHIAYKKDEEGKEQIRSPARSWYDRRKGVDCDCYTVFISSILSNLKIPHQLRITKYWDVVSGAKNDHFQHIYPIVPLSDGTYITIDCVVRNFNKEEPYSEKKDTKMDLEYLNGVNDSTTTKNTDISDLMGRADDSEVMAELGRILRRKAEGGKKISLFKPKASGEPSKKGLFKGKLKAVVKKGVHLTNRVNPAAALLRAGILASAKLNLMKVSQRLKYAYLSDAEAQKRGIDMGKFSRLKQVKEKLEKIFYGAGGKPENLKQAILTGKGNKNKEVNGLAYVSYTMEGLDENTALSTLLGADLHGDEFLSIEGLGELGEPATATAITAASGVIGAIAGLLKSIGNIFTKKNQAQKDFEEGENDVKTSGDGGSNMDSSATNAPSSVSEGKSGDVNSESNDAANSEENAEGGSPANSGKGIPKKSSGSGDAVKTEGFWLKHKKWLKPLGIGIGALGAVLAGFSLMRGKKNENPKASLSGIPKSNKHKKKKGGTKKKKKSKNETKQVVELL